MFPKSHWHWYIVTFFITTTLAAEVSLDGTLGAPVTLIGPDYAIGAELGQQRGHNLFHSFHDFSLEPHERVTFSGPDPVNNIISRVTGGNPSHLNGTLRSTIPQANIFLLNPAGVMIGPHAKLDISGSFHVSTADTIQFQDGNEFSVHQPQPNLLSTAPPSAFGFISDSPTSLSVTGNSLAVPPSKTLSLIGGTIEVKQSALFAQSGRINMGSLSQAGQVTLLSDDVTLSASPGDIIVQDSSISTSGEGGGSIYIRGGRFELHNSQVSTHTFGTKADRGIDIQADELRATTVGKVISTTSGTGKGGNINIKVTTLTEFSGSEHKQSYSGIFSYSGGEFEAAGDAGDIQLETGELHLKEGSNIESVTYGSGLGGNITIQVAGLAKLFGESNILLITANLNENAGQSGILELRATQLVATDGAQIGTGTTGTGRGGDVHLQVAKDIIISGENSSGSPSGIFAISEGEMEQAGDAGELILQANNLKLIDGSQISATTFGPGQGGAIKIRVTDSIKLIGNNQAGVGSLITSSTAGLMAAAGRGGTIELAAQQLQLNEGGRISANTFGSGPSGSIRVKITDQARFSGQDSLGFPSGIFTVADNLFTHKTGHAGELVLQAREVQLQSGAHISAQSNTDGRSGNITVHANRMNMNQNGVITTSSHQQGDAGDLEIKITESLQMKDSFITTETNHADGGNIAIHSPGYLYLINSAITTSVHADKGNSGNIVLTPEFILLDQSGIIANAFEGRGGNIDMVITGIYELSDSTIETSSKLGVDGEVIINSPDVNVGEEMVVLPATFVNATNLLQAICGKSKGGQSSQFIVIPLVGSPPEPTDWQASPPLPDLIEKRTLTNPLSPPTSGQTHQVVPIINIACH